VDYRLLQVVFVFAFGGLKLQLQVLQLTNKNAAIKITRGMMSLAFILQK
jgi:hypothetical protein